MGKYLIVFVFLFGMYTPGIAQEYNSIITSLEKASEKIAGSMVNYRQKGLAVTGIRTMAGKTNGLTGLLEELLTTQLLNKGLFPRERTRLAEICRENGLSLRGSFDKETAIKVGEFANAKAIVTGTLALLGQNYILTLRVSDCSTGILIPGSGFVGEIPRTRATENLYNQKGGLTVSVFPPEITATVYVDNSPRGNISGGINVLNFDRLEQGRHTIKVKADGYPDRELKVKINAFEIQILNIVMFQPLKIQFWQENTDTNKVIGNNGNIYTGNNYRFCFKSNRNAHVYIFNLGSSGHFFKLFPYKNSNLSNYIPANQLIKIPETGGFRLNLPAGVEKIYVLASISPIKDLDKTKEMLLGNKQMSEIYETTWKDQKLKTYVKDYGQPPSQPAVFESASLDPNGSVAMELTYTHQ